MSGLLVLGVIVGIIVVFDLLVAAFGVDSRPGFSDRFGTLS
jgi:hypothetical protein